MPKGPKGEKRPADVIATPSMSCGSQPARLKKPSLTMAKARLPIENSEPNFCKG